jgi:hypothetical protein
MLSFKLFPRLSQRSASETTLYPLAGSRAFFPSPNLVVDDNGQADLQRLAMDTPSGGDGVAKGDVLR